MVTRMLGMHKLLERLERLERRAATRTGCHCSKVVWHNIYIPSAEFGLLPANHPIPHYDRRMTLELRRRSL
jgi:hypothetical protein